MLTQDQLRANFEKTLKLMDDFPQGKAPAQMAAKKIAAALADLGIPYVVCGGLAVGAYGLQRTTVDVDLILEKADLARFKKRWLGLGWVEPFKGSKGLKDAEFKIGIDVLTPEEIPGDGKSVPFKFPHPEGSGVDLGGIWAGVQMLALPRLLELKIACGMTCPHRPRDYDDAIRLIATHKLPRDYGKQLHAYVQPKFDELWGYAQTPGVLGNG